MRAFVNSSFDILIFNKSLEKLTGIFEVFKNSSNASNEPRVDACTKTP